MDRTRCDEARCAQVRERLSDYLDGELDGWGAAVVRAHLASCLRCGRFAGELAATVLALHALGTARALRS